MSKRILMSIVLIIIAGFCSVNIFSDGVYAGSGTGSDESSTEMDDICNNKNAIGSKDKLCGTDFGGWNWRIFKTASSWDSDTGIYNTSPRPHYDTGKDPLRGDTRFDKKIYANCPNDKYDYYIAAIYNGWKWEGDKKKSVFRGPISADYSGKYNDLGDILEANEFYEGIRDKTLSNGQKVSRATVKKVCADEKTGPCKNYTDTSKSLPDT